MRNVPYARQWIFPEDIRAVGEILKSDFLTQGPVVQAFEKKVADYCGAKYAVAVNSGTSALHCACYAAGIDQGDEVITSPITFVASSNCILYCGGTPVFSDVDAGSINLDPVRMREKISKRTKAVIPVHFAGNPCDMDKIRKIAKEKDIYVIEDASHALGGEYKGSKIGSCTHSDMSVLSFHAVKNITTGEGGMVLTNERNLFEKLLLFRNHGITRDSKKMTRKNEGQWYYEMQSIGYNYRITDFQCALGLQQVKKIDVFIKKRRQIVKRYNETFCKMDQLILPEESKNGKSGWHLYVLRLKDPRKRRPIFEDLRNRGVLVNVHYIPVPMQVYYANILKYSMTGLSVAKAYYESAITLPLYPKMTNSDVDYVIDNVTEIIRKRA